MAPTVPSRRDATLPTERPDDGSTTTVVDETKPLTVRLPKPVLSASRQLPARAYDVRLSLGDLDSSNRSDVSWSLLVVCFTTP